jgi:probable metal-binding protein
MAEQIHAHELFNLIGASETGLSELELEQAVKEKFGDAEFTNCGGLEFDFKGVLNFIKDRQKVVVREGRLFLNSENICH